MTASYRNYESEAHELIQRILQSSIGTILQESSNNVRESEYTIEWPKGEGFTVEKGTTAIETFVKSWAIGNSWKYCIDFLVQRERLYCYGVKWSEPTRRKPVPKATASVYFYLFAHSEDVPVLVFYIVEGQRLVHRPGETAVFHEIWLRNVVQNKLVITAAASLALDS